MRPILIITGILIFGVLMTGVTCETGVRVQVKYDGGEWLITNSLNSANGTSAHEFWGEGPYLASTWFKVLKDQETVGGPDVKAVVNLGVDEGEYELQFFDAEGNIIDSLAVKGGNEKGLVIDLPLGALRYGYGVSASNAKGVRYEIKLIFPTNAEEQLSLGTELAQQRRLEEAIVKFNEAIRLDPNLADAYANRGLANRLLGQHESAIEDYDEAIRLNPQSALVYANRGAAYLIFGQFEKAIRDTDEAIRLDPQIALAYVTRGAAYGGLGQHEQAIQDLDEAIRLDPQAAMAYNNRGNVYGGLGQFEEAIQDLDEAIRLDPQLAPAYASRAQAYAFLGKDKEAKADRDKACQLDKQHC